jgi:uncharacterized protein (UPF0332 family)
MNGFEECLRKGKIKKFPRIIEKVGIELGAARDDLASGNKMFKRGEFKFATIAGYYSLFHAARALLYSQGFRERSHYCLRLAIERLFVEEKLLEPELLEYFDEALGLREAADYQSIFSKEGAKRALGGAREFLKAVREVLES